MSGVIQDVRYAARGLAKTPSFTAIAVLTLAVGIGANTAIFSVVDSALLRPLSYADSNRLYVIHEVNTRSTEMPLIPVNVLHFREWQRHVRSFEEMALVGSTSLNLTGTGDPERLPAGRVSPNLFAMLGARIQLGRTFAEDEDQPGRDRVVILNAELWRRRFAADPSIVGRRITLNSEPYEVIGVLSDDFRFPKLSDLYELNIRSAERPIIWRPFVPTTQELTPFGAFNFVSIARLRLGASPSQATAELDAIQVQFAKQTPNGFELRAAVVPLQDQMTGRARGGLQLMLATVAIVLLIGCINLANLLLARATRRQREIGIRRALGATRGRLIRQALAESLILSCVGSVIGIALASAAIRLLIASAPVELPRMDEVGLDARVVTFTTGIALLTGLLIGTLPAWRFAQSEPVAAMRSSSRTATVSRAGGRVRLALMAFEVAITVMCLIAGGLLLHSFAKLLNVDRGFDVERIVTLEVNLPANRYADPGNRHAFARAILDEIDAMPGVTSAAASSLVPLTGEVDNSTLAVEGTTLPQGARPNAGLQFVSPRYFRTMGISILSGRTFDDSDRDRRVAIVSVLTAERLWPGQNALGKRFRRGLDTSQPFEVIGVVATIRRLSLDEPPSLHVYEPYWQALPSRVSFVVRANTGPSAVFIGLRESVRMQDPELPIPAFRTMDDVLSESVAARRFQMNLVIGLGAIAVLLAACGIYAMVSYTVTQRTQELGIRMALGAMPKAVQRMVIKESLAPVGLGLIAGIVGSLILGRAMRALLFDLTPNDGPTYVMTTAVVLTAAISASYLPARRAARVDPLVALRYE